MSPSVLCFPEGIYLPDGYPNGPAPAQRETSPLYLICPFGVVRHPAPSHLKRVTFLCWHLRAPLLLFFCLCPFTFCPHLLVAILSESTRSCHCCFACPSYCPPGFMLLSRCFTSLPHSTLRFFSIGQACQLCQPIVSIFVDWTDRLIIIVQMSWQTDHHYYTNVTVQKIGHHQFKQLFTFFVHPFHVHDLQPEENARPSMPFCFLPRTSVELDCLIASREDNLEIRCLDVSFFMS